VYAISTVNPETTVTELGVIAALPEPLILIVVLPVVIVVFGAVTRIVRDSVTRLFVGVDPIVIDPLGV
jgi:hypothetical protein